jgi:hypothetical protein
LEHSDQEQYARQRQADHQSSLQSGDAPDGWTLNHV